MDPIFLYFDMANYHPGAHSMTGWLVNNFMTVDGKPKGEYSLTDIYKNADRVTIQIINFHKAGFTSPSQFAWFMRDFQGLIKRGFTFDIQDPYISDLNVWQPNR